jgi:hypothetical protein
MMDAPVAYEVGKRFPLNLGYGGFRMMWSGGHPTIIIGMPNLTFAEIRTVENDSVLYQLGNNNSVAWLMMTFPNLSGEVFFCAGLQPDEFEPETVSQLYNQLGDTMGFACHVMLVDTHTGILAVNRLNGWSNKLSKAFLDAAMVTKLATRGQHDRAVDALQKQTHKQLCAMAHTQFMLPCGNFCKNV